MVRFTWSKLYSEYYFENKLPVFWGLNSSDSWGKLTQTIWVVIWIICTIIEALTIWNTADSNVNCAT